MINGNLQCADVPAGTQLGTLKIDGSRQPGVLTKALCDRAHSQNTLFLVIYQLSKGRKGDVIDNHLVDR